MHHKITSFTFQSLIAYKHYMFIAINNWLKYKENNIKQGKACIGLNNNNNVSLQNRAEQYRTEQNRAEQNRTEQNRTEQNRIETLLTCTTCVHR